MADDSKFQFKIYSAKGVGVIDSGYYDEAMVILEITTGDVYIEIGTDKIEAFEGDFVFVPSMLVYRVCSFDPASVRVMVFSSPMIEENLENFDTEIFYMFFVQSRTGANVFTKEHPIYEKLVYSMDEAYEEYISKDVCYKLPVRANIYLLMTALLRYYCGRKDELDRMIYHNVMRLRPVIDYINKNFSEKIYIETLADMITVSPDYFTKMFKDSIGKTPIDYINAVRVNQALRLLSMTDTPVNEIAELIGFSNANYFHKIFKQYMDSSPLVYRKNAKSAEI